MNLSQFTWKRPHELVDEPSIYVDGTSRKDVIQVGVTFAPFLSFFSYFKLHILDFIG